MANESLKSLPPPRVPLESTDAEPKGAQTEPPQQRLLAAVAATKPSPSSPILLDMTIKRLELQEKTYDGLTTRSGAILAFSAFLIPKYVDALKELSAHPKLQMFFGALFCLALLTMSVSCYLGMKLYMLRVYPNPAELAKKGEHHKSDFELKHLLFQESTEVYENNTLPLKKKTRAFRWALLSLVVLLVSLVGALVAGLLSSH